MAPSATNESNGTNGTFKIQFETFSNIVNGKATPTSKTRHGINPANKKANIEVPVATQKDVDDAVAAAKVAFQSWSRTSIGERREKVVAYAAALKAHTAEFAKLLTTEQGKPLSHATHEVEASAHFLDGIARLELDDEVLEENEDRKVITRHTPLGVVAAIVPWNFPVHLACGKIASALLTGNCIIIKPSPFTPYCGLKLAELGQKFFPPGVFQALSGDDNLGPMLTAHPGIDKISFTGSTATGKRVMESASKTLKRVTLELGGKDPAIVCKSVNIAETAPKIATFSFLNSGQICVAVKRVYIHKDIYDKFRDAMVAHVKTLTMGDGMEEGNFLGPLQNSMQYEIVKAFFNDIEKEGQKVAVGGTLPQSNAKGYFIEPTIIDSPKEDSRLVVEEPFGPILPILLWSDEEDVIDRANNTTMGLGASVWSNDLDEAERIAKRLEAGSVWVNAHADIDPRFPFGGHKQSGLGSEWGVSGLKAYTNSQTVYLKKRV
ncbi:aldehyde dehydrogenase FUS7 [Hyphodiscus hymeniophilus]|uniref:aldehyde dehydrogenase (NAD(+)) n=1 Tax=Hyphodiscus hymeniophilus TaxID=353542 RepID=A0A9P6VDZ3_9HELO|nr:aldehyde dehydrogenase FUS7 [Hyphodiscus hymeniophilus]